jgi:hypothetical protein
MACTVVSGDKNVECCSPVHSQVGVDYSRKQLTLTRSGLGSWGRSPSNSLIQGLLQRYREELPPELASRNSDLGLHMGLNSGYYVPFQN